MTCHMSFTKIPRITSPPLVPFHPSAEQTRFLRLHSPAGSVTQWQWLFGSTMLRATTDSGTTATIWRDALDELVRAGLMRWGHGSQVLLTTTGLEFV